MEPKALPPAKISAIKLFNKSSLTVRKNKIGVDSLRKETPGSNIIVVKKQVIHIKNLIATNTILKAKEEERKRKETEKKRFAEKEERLEKPKDEGKERIKLPAAPKLGFLDRIKKFLFNVFLGFVVYRLIPHIPKMMGVVKLAGQAIEGITDWAGKLLNGLVTFVDWGYKAYDSTRNFLKNLGGENTLKVFDGFIGAMDKVIEASIIAAIAFTELDGGGGPDTPRKAGKGVAGRGITRAGKRFGLKLIGKDATKQVLRFIKPIAGKLPLIGGLLEFGISWALGDPIGKAAFRGVGATLLGAIGTAIGGPIGLAIGGLAGGEIGGFLYDIIFGNKSPQNKKVQGRAQGGSITRGGKFVGGPARREVKKDVAKRQVSITPPQLKPGSAVGGDKKIQKIFPESTTKDTVNPLGYTEDFYKKTSDIPFFGPIFGLVTKTLLGDKPSSLDYDNIGKGLNSWMNNTFSGEVLRTGGAFAGGGEVNAEMFMRGEDLTKVIAKSVEDSVSTRLDDTMNDLMKQLGLKEIDRGKGPGGGPGAEEEPTGSPTLTGNTNAEKVFRYLVDKEGFTPEAAAGIIGNLMQESGVNPKSRQLGGGPGRGIMQWTESERWASLSAWASNSGKDPWALETQVEWMIKEMKSYGTYNRIKGVSSYKKAVEIFEREMERAGTPNYPRRYQYAADALASFGGGAGGPGIQLGKGYGGEGSKIAGELGRYIKSQLNSPAQFQAVTEHPEHGGIRGRHATNSYHYSGRALDIGAYTHEQGPILNVIAQFNRMKGIKPVELLHGGNDAGHRDHVHVALAKGGLVRGFTRAIIGEKGPEFVIDADSTAALEQNFPGFLDAINKANYAEAINVLRNYASYEYGAGMEVVVEQPEPEVVPVMMPMPMGGSSYDSSFGEGESFDGLYNRG